VLFLSADDQFASSDPHVTILMEVHSRACIDHTLATTGVRVTTGKENIMTGKKSQFTWTKEGTGNKIDFIHNLCVEEVEWKFYPAKYHENTYEIDLEFTQRSIGQPFTVTAAIDIKQGDVLSDIGFTADIVAYEDEECKVESVKFRLGQKFYTKITLQNLVINAATIKCNTYRIIQEKDQQETITDMMAEAKYAFVEIPSNTINTHICGAELESHHFHISVEGYHTRLETEIEITYEQGNTRRKLIQIPLTRQMLEAAGYYDIEYETAIGMSDLSEEDLEFQNTKREPDTDDMVVEMYVEAEKAVGIIFGEGTSSSFGQFLMISVFIAGLGYAAGYFRTKSSDNYTSLIEMK